MIVENHPLVAKFIAEAIGEEGFGDCYTFGNVVDDTLIGGCVFNNYTGLSVQMTAAGKGLWCTHEFLKTCFSFAFIGLKCRRITVLVAVSNTKALKLNKHLGFIEEGLVRMGEGEDDLILLGMLKSECRYL
jgi:RimJ/RimL family protein N-acetyltransferase